MRLTTWVKRFREEPYRFSTTEMTWRLVHAAHIDAQANNYLSEQNLNDLNFARNYLLVALATKDFSYEVKKSIACIEEVCKKWKNNNTVDLDLLDQAKTYIERIL